MKTRLQYLGWASFILTSPQGAKIIFDPSLKGAERSGIPPSSFRAEDIDVDLIVASHGAKDHFGEAFEIMRNCPETKLLCGIDMLYHAEKEGFGTKFDGRAELMVSGCSYPYKDMVIRCLDARHISFTRYQDRPVTGTAMCYVVQIQNGPTFFFGGDTSVTMDFELWGKLYRPDVAMMGISGALQYAGRPLMELDPVESAIAADMLGARVMIPMHYSNPDHLREFHEQAKVRARNCRIVDMVCGDILEFDEPLPFRRVGSAKEP